MYRKHYRSQLSVKHQLSLRFSYLETLLVFLLLLVDYAETKVDFVGFFEVWLHAHHLRESLFCMLKRSIAIIQDSDSVP